MEIKLNPFIRISLLTLLIFYVIGSPLSISLSFWPDFYQSNNVASPSSAFAVTQDILIIKDNLNHPSGVAVDGIGNIYAADTLNDRIVVFDPTGKLLESIGSKKLASDNNTESDKDKSGELNHPSGVAVDGIGNIYAADTLNDRIVVFDPTGKLLESIGSKKLASDNNTESDKDKSGELNHPSGVAVDGIGNIYAADTLNDRIVVFDPTGKLLESIGSKKLASDNNTESDKDKSGELNHPSGVAVDGIGNIYAADTLNDRIVVFDPTGKLLESIGSKKLASDNNTESDKDKSGELNHPSGVAVDGIGNIYAADTLNDRIVVFDPTGKLLESIGSKKLASDNNTESDKGEPGQFKHPFGIAVDNICNIYVADTLNDRIQKITKCIGHNLSVQLTESVGVDDGLVSVTTAKPTSVQLTESVGVDDGLVSVTTAEPTSVQLTESVGVDDGLVSVTTAKPTSVQLTESVGVEDEIASVTTAKHTSKHITESVRVEE